MGCSVAEVKAFIENLKEQETPHDAIVKSLKDRLQRQKDEMETSKKEAQTLMAAVASSCSAKCAYPIYVKDLMGNTTVLDVSGGDSVEKVKAMIEKERNIPSSQQRLRFAGKQLADNEMLAACGCLPESTLHLVLARTPCEWPAGKTIYVKTLGKRFSIVCASSDTVDDAKAKVQDSERSETMASLQGRRCT